VVMTDFRPDVETWPFRACTLKICIITSSVIVESVVGQIPRAMERISSIF